MSSHFLKLLCLKIYIFYTFKKGVKRCMKMYIFLISKCFLADQKLSEIRMTHSYMLVCCRKKSFLSLTQKAETLDSVFLAYHASRPHSRSWSGQRASLRRESSGEVVKEAICKSPLPLGNLAAVSKRGHFQRGETRTVGGMCFSWVSCKAG